MSTLATPTSTHSLEIAKRIATGLLGLCMIALIGCGGTKVYTIDKTVTYRDEMYNMSTVQKIAAREEAKLADGSVVNIRNKDKKAMQAMFKENGEMLISMLVEMDQQEMVYLRMNVDNYSDYSRMKKKFDSAMKDISKFMGDKKATQLKLK